MELQTLFRKPVDDRFGIEPAALRFGNADSVHDVATDALRPQQWCVGILGIIPIGVHAEKVQLLVENRTDFLLYPRVDGQAENAILLRPLIAIHGISLLSALWLVSGEALRSFLSSATVCADAVPHGSWGTQ